MSAAPVGDDRDPIFRCAGEMAERYATLDWAATPLGPVATWPESLRNATALMLRSGFAMNLTWGEDFVMLYNDAFIPTLMGKHPACVGSRLCEVFSEVWDQIGPMFDRVLHGGDHVFDEDQPFVLGGPQGSEETFFTFSSSHVPPTPGRDGGVGPGGVLTVLTQTTKAVVGARRLGLLNDLATRSGRAADRGQAIEAVLDVLRDATVDLAYGCWVIADDAGDLHPLGSFGDLPVGWCDDVRTRSCVAQALSTVQIVVEGASEPTPPGPAHVVALPIRGREGVIGGLVLAPQQMRPLDTDHLRFLNLVADQVTQVIGLADARAAEAERLEVLAALDAARSAFLSNVSHEFRTPLTLLLGPLETALSATDPSLTREEMEMMQRSALRLLRMVEALLDLATLESGTFVPQWDQVDLRALTSELLAPFTPAATRAGLGFEVDLGESTGAVDTDPGLWETIVLNLVANALKYTHAGSVRVHLARDGHDVVLSVTDTGVGIPAEDVPHVFDRFHRSPGLQGRQIEGIGLGLALVHDAVAALGGSVTATSTPGSGSRFVARVPARSSRVQASYDDVAATRTTGAADLSMARSWAEDISPLPDLLDDAATSADVAAEDLPLVLVVDDNAAMRQRLRQVLSRIGRVRTAGDGLAALAILRAVPIDLVVSDVTMPRVDGLELVAAVRADPLLATIPVILVSARGESTTAIEAMEARADDYVVKPFTEETLVARCRATLELARLRAETTAHARTRATMLAGVSHDMQTPLAVILSALSLLAEEQGLSPEQRAIASRAVVRGEQLGRLVHTFLDWSRITTGVELEPRVKVVEVLGLVERVAAVYLGIKVISDDEAADVRVDVDRTANIVHNLIDNAMRAARGTVTIRVVAHDTTVDIEVVDDGPGVDPTLLPRLFESFSSTSERGTGLGLHISRLAARAQGGDLALRSTGPAGAIFVLTVPRA